MKATSFLEPSNPSAESFLEERTFKQKALDFLTMGHVEGEYGPEKEVSFDASGKMTRANVPTGDPGFFQDPVTALSMGGFAGVKAAGGLVSKGLAAGRETLGWITGGGSEVPALAKAGAKGILKAAESKPLAEAAAKRAGKPFAEVPVSLKAEEFLAEPISKIAAEATPQITPKVEPSVGKIVEPGATSQAKQMPTASSDSLIPEVKGGATGELPKYAEGSAINLERLNTSEDVKQFINQRTTELEPKIGKRKVSWDETRATAEALGWDQKEIRKAWNKKGAFTAAEIDATRQTNVNRIVALQEKIRNLPHDTTTLPPEVRADVLDAIDLIKVTSQAASEAGRSLNIHKRVLSKDPSFTAASEMARALNAISGKGGKRTDDLINKLRDIDFSDTAAVNRFVYDATKTPWQKLSDGAFELWMNGLLSNPLTHIVNTTSNALTMAYQYPERLLGAGIEAARAKATGTAKGVFLGETAQDIFSISKGLTDAVNRFTHTMKFGEKVTKLDYRPSAIPDKFAKYLPTRALTAEDAFFKGFIENQEMNRLAYRKAAKEGLRGEAFQNRISELLLHPDEAMLGEVAKRGEYLTYQQEVGEAGRLIFNAREKIPGLKYFIPFVKTPMNIAKFALERTPMNLARLVWKAKKGELQGAQLSEELAKPLMGTMLATTVYQLAENGYITGGVPKSKAEREEKQNTGWQPYSVKIGDKYYSFARLEPLGSIMGMAAALSQIKNSSNEDEKFNIAYGLMDAIKTNISDKVFMQGLTNLIQTLNDPGRYLSNVANTFVGSLVPAVGGGIARSTDDTVRDVRGPIDAAKVRMPGVSNIMPEKLTVWGEPIERPGSAAGRFLSPMQISEAKGAPIERELVKLDIDIGYPSRKIKDYELPQEQYWQMVKEAGTPAKKILNKLVTSNTWTTIDDDIKNKLIASVVGQFRDAARTKLEAQLIRQGKIKLQQKKGL